MFLYGKRTRRIPQGRAAVQIPYIRDSSPTFFDGTTEHISQSAALDCPDELNFDGSPTKKLRHRRSRFFAIFGRNKSASAGPSVPLPSRDVEECGSPAPVAVARTSEAASSPFSASLPPLLERPSSEASSLPPDSPQTPVAFEAVKSGPMTDDAFLIASSPADTVDGSVESNPLPLSSERRSSDTLCSSTSLPGFSRQVSRKLTNCFAQPTVVHRPKSSKRASVLPGVGNGYPSVLERFPSGMTAGEAAASNISSQNATWSPFSFASTAPTSVFTDSNPRSVETKSRKNSTQNRSQIGVNVLHERVPSLGNPSIVTVENTAAAKVFLETYFNTILSCDVSARTRRRDELERKLALQGAASRDRERLMKQLEHAESDHLRQVRVLKATSLPRLDKKNTNLPGYEAIKVLGKGSFGVVKLVREVPEHSPESSTSIDGSAVDPRKLFNGTEDTYESWHGRGRPRRSRNQVYAMKVIRKSDMLRNSQEGHIRAERDFLVASEQARWVVPLVASFEDNGHLYLVMEYMPGGDFLAFLMREEVLDENVAKWYIAEMISCVEEAHQMGWMHRDVKPDNFLITASGHLKIADFGLAFDGHWSHNQTYYNRHRYSLAEQLGILVRGDERDRDEEREVQKSARLARIMHPRGLETKMPGMEHSARKEGVLNWLNRTQQRRLAKSVVGTSQYMAPEVVRSMHGIEYDGRCDWWSIGVILYEASSTRRCLLLRTLCLSLLRQQCLYGMTPFYSADRDETKRKIEAHSKHLKFPNGPRYACPRGNRAMLPPVGILAIDLIERLLQDKDTRLSCQRYRQNDLEEADASVSANGRSSVARSSQPHLPAPVRALERPSPSVHKTSNGLLHHRRREQTVGGDSLTECHFVYPNDAEEIKSHAFFHGIPWGRLDQMRPPFVPHFGRGRSLTQYFDYEPTVDEDADESSPSSTPSRTASPEPTRWNTSSVSAPASTPSPSMPSSTSSSRARQDRILTDLAAASRSIKQSLRTEQGTPRTPPKGADKVRTDWNAHLRRLVTKKRPNSGSAAAATRAHPPLPPPRPFRRIPGPQPMPGDAPAPASTASADGMQPASRPAKRQHRDRKRARDKILRDPALGVRVLALRKRDAFVGYTYRRPRIQVLDELERVEAREEVGREVRRTRAARWGGRDGESESGSGGVEVLGGNEWGFVPTREEGGTMG